MKNKNVAFRFDIAINESYASIIVLNQRMFDEFTNVNFYVLVDTYDNSRLKIPAGRTASFKEELRVLGKANCTVAIGSNQIQTWAEKMIKEAYGSFSFLISKEI